MLKKNQNSRAVSTASVEQMASQTANTKRNQVPSRKTKLQALRWQRLAIQIIFLIFAPQTFSLAFAGVKQIFAAIGQMEAFETNTFFILMVMLLAFTVVFGRFFCGFLCAFGTIGDILYQLGDALCKAVHLKRPRMPLALENKLRYLKCVVLAFFLLTSIAGLTSTISMYSPWTAFGRLLSLNISELNVVGLGLLVLIALCMIFKERFFCEFLCPLGAIFSLLPVLPFSIFRRDLKRCNNCGACRHNCPVSITVPGEGSQMGECISCGRCAQVCPHACVGQCSAAKLAARLEAIDVEAIDAQSKTNETPDIKQGNKQDKRPAAPSNTVRIIVLAAVAFVLFWVLGAVDHLPLLF